MSLIFTVTLKEHITIFMVSTIVLRKSTSSITSVMVPFSSGVSRLQKLVGPINCKCPVRSTENFASDHAHFRSIPLIH